MVEISRVEIKGHSIAYRHSGEGPAIVLLHGFLCDSRCWRMQFEGLSNDFRIIAWDAPGAGLSSDPPETFTINDWVECLDGLLDELELESFIIAGLSWGGMLAQEFYREYPHRIRKMILADTYAGWKGSLPQDAVKKRVERCIGDSELPADEFIKRWVPEMFSESAPESLLQEMSEIFSGFHPHGFRLMAKSLAETDTADMLPHIEVPTLLLWGDDDKRSPLGIAEQFHVVIPNSELCVIRNAGHVSNMEQPEEFNEKVRKFCEE